MSNLSDMRRVSYENSKREFYEKFQVYQRKNSTYKGVDRVDGVIAPVWSITTEEALQVFDKLSSMIHYACVINEEQKDVILESENIKFFSGIRFIDNIVKHSKDFSIQIYDIIKTTPRIQGKRIDGMLQIRMSMEMCFGDIEQIEVPKANEKQKENYGLMLKGRSLLDVVGKLDNIMETYYFVN